MLMVEIILWWTATTNVKVVGGNLTNVYGGGKLADTGETNVTLTSGTIRTYMVVENLQISIMKLNRY